MNNRNSNERQLQVYGSDEYKNEVDDMKRYEEARKRLEVIRDPVKNMERIRKHLEDQRIRNLADNKITNPFTFFYNYYWK